MFRTKSRRMFKLGILALLMASLLLNVNLVQATRSGIYYQSPPTVIANWLALELAHPDQISHGIFGYTVQGAPLYIFKVGNPNGGRVMWDGDIHGSEDTGTQAGYWFSNWLVTSGTARAAKILEGNYFLVIPYVNYDGALTGSRVNKHGVNLNRNFPYDWSSASSDPNDPQGNYRGPSPASEPETQAMITAWTTYHPLAYFNIHTGGSGSWGGSNTVSAKAIVTNINSRYAAECTAEGISKLYAMSNSRLGSGEAQGDAYGRGIASYLVETQDWASLPPTLAEWKTNWYPSCFAVIVSALESVQVSGPTPSPSPIGTGTIEVTAVKNGTAVLVTSWIDSGGASGPAWILTFDGVPVGTHTVYGLCEGVQKSRQVNVASGATVQVEFDFTASTGSNGTTWSNVVTDIVDQIQALLGSFHFSNMTWVLIAVAVVVFFVFTRKD